MQHVRVVLRARELPAPDDLVAKRGHARVAPLLVGALPGLVAGERRGEPRPLARAVVGAPLARARRRLDVGEREGRGVDLEAKVEAAGARLELRRQPLDLALREAKDAARARLRDALGAQRGDARADAARGGAARRRALDLLLEAAPQHGLGAGDGQADLLWRVVLGVEIGAEQEVGTTERKGEYCARIETAAAAGCVQHSGHPLGNICNTPHTATNNAP